MALGVLLAKPPAPVVQRKIGIMGLPNHTQEWVEATASTQFTKTAEEAYNALRRGEDTPENRKAIWQSGYWSAQAIMHIDKDPLWIEALCAESGFPDSGLGDFRNYLGI